MTKIIATVLLIFFSNVQAQNFITALKPLYACEEAVVTDNAYLKNYKWELWPLISVDCANQMQAAQAACAMESNHNADECVDIINKQLDLHYLEIVNTNSQGD